MPASEMRENRQHSTVSVPYSFYECRIPELYMNVPMHWHEEFEINRILSGSGEFICGDDKVTAKKGDMLIFPPDTLHAAYLRERGELIYQAFVFHPVMLGANGNDRCAIEYVRPMTKGIIRPRTLIERNAANYEALKATADKIFSYAGTDGAEEGRHSNSPREELLLKSELLRFFGLLECRDTESDSISYSEIIRPALEYMVKNYRENIRVEELAELVHLSKSHFMSCFKRAVGVGAIEYLAGQRISAVCRMLTDTKESVADIAYNCGYNNLSNFNRQFLKIMRCSPREYRKRGCEITPEIRAK